jgi:hypothetical protein
MGTPNLQVVPAFTVADPRTNTITDALVVDLQRRKVAQVEASTCPPHQRESAVRGAHSAHDLFPCPTTLLCSHSCALFGPLAIAHPQLAHVEPATKWESQCTTQVRISWCTTTLHVLNATPALPRAFTTYRSTWQVHAMLAVSGVTTKTAAFTGAGAGAGLVPQASAPRAPISVSGRAITDSQTRHIIVQTLCGHVHADSSCGFLMYSMP